MGLEEKCLCADGAEFSSSFAHSLICSSKQTSTLKPLFRPRAHVVCKDMDMNKPGAGSMSLSSQSSRGGLKCRGDGEGLQVLRRSSRFSWGDYVQGAEGWGVREDLSEGNAGGFSISHSLCSWLTLWTKVKLRQWVTAVKEKEGKVQGMGGSTHGKIGLQSESIWASAC